MWSSFAVDGYLHTVASVGFLFILNFDARNHELKKGNLILTIIIIIIIIIIFPLIHYTL